MGGGNRSGSIDVAATLTAKGQRIDFEVETFIAEVTGTLTASLGRRSGTPNDDNPADYLIAFDTTQITSKTNRSNPQPGHPCHPLAAQAHPPALAYRTSGNNGAWETGDKVDALTTNTDRTSHLIASGWAVRRLTPPECARLQGFPDDHSRIPWRGKPAELCPDGPQYKTYGNSMATKKMRWLAQRLAAELKRVAA